MAARDEIKRLQAQIQEEIENVAKNSQVNVTDDNIIVKERESGQSEKDRRESQTDVQDDTVLSNERGILDQIEKADSDNFNLDPSQDERYKIIQAAITIQRQARVMIARNNFRVSLYKLILLKNIVETKMHKEKMQMLFAFEQFIINTEDYGDEEEDMDQEDRYATKDGTRFIDGSSRGDNTGRADGDEFNEMNLEQIKRLIEEEKDPFLREQLKDLYNPLYSGMMEAEQYFQNTEDIINEEDMEESIDDSRSRNVSPNRGQTMKKENSLNANFIPTGKGVQDLTKFEQQEEEQKSEIAKPESIGKQDTSKQKTQDIKPNAVSKQPSATTKKTQQPTA